MKTRLAAIAAVTAVLLGGLFAAPAAAANSVVVATPVVTATVYPGSAYDTATVTGDVNSTPGGTLTYTFFTGDDCTSTGTPAGTVTLPGAPTAPSSDTEGPLAAGPYSFGATYNGDGVNDPSPLTCESFTIGKATPTTPTITNIPASAAVGGSFPASVSTTGDGTKSVTSNSTGVCTVGADGLTVTYVAVGTCSLTAQVAAGTDYTAASGTAQTFAVGRGTPTAPTISNIPTTATFGGSGFTASVSTTGDGVKSVTSNSTGVCTVGVGGLAVSYVAAGTCSLTAQVAAGTDYTAASGTAQTFTVAQEAPTTPTITNLPASGTYGGGFTATVSTTGDGVKSVTSNTATVCTASGLTVSYVGVGTCSLNAQVAAGTNYLSGSGTAQNVTVGRAVPSTPTITNIPSPANEFFGFTAIVGTNGDGTKSVTSNTPGVCSVGTNGLTVTFVGFGTCSLTPSVAQGSNYFGATGSPQTFPVNEASHGYWLVGSDGGIFSFGTAAFHGSMGGIPLQRPVVGITPTSTGNGYWLVASDGGIFSFGDATFYGSIPEVGLHPAGSGLPNSLNAPIVGMVPTSTGEGYFMVASDGGVFAFGDARFEGSCPGIGGCAGAAVAVMPDNSGKGYWLVTSTGSVYAFGDAPFYGASPPSTVPAVDAVATPDGHGYWLLYANGIVASFGDAGHFGGPYGYVDFYNPATAIFPTKDGLGYWIASARGDVFTYGVAPFLGGLAATGLNGVIIAGYGF